MAKNSRAQRIRRLSGIGIVLAQITSLVVGAGSVMAGGLPLREGGLAPDRGLVALRQTLDFRLAHLAGGSDAAWAAMVDDTLLLARRLGFPSDALVTAQRHPGIYVILLQGELMISGADPDRVLGRLLYTLAHDENVAPPSSRGALALSILDQPMSTTLTALTSSSSASSPSTSSSSSP